MFITGGLSHYLIPSMSNIYSTGYSPPIDSVSNSAAWPISNRFADFNVKHVSHKADDAHDMAYSAYTHRIKRTAKDFWYSETTCQKASQELASLVNIVVTNPGTWYRYKSQINNLQSITNSASCRGRV